MNAETVYTTDDPGVRIRGQRRGVAAGGGVMDPSVHFRSGHKDEADALVRKFHYSTRPPANVQAVGTWHTDGGLFGDSGPAVAACYFSIPPTRWSEPIWELSRLVRVEEPLPPLSGLVSSTVSYIKKRKAHPGVLVSFADAAQGHHGGIYQACSWNYHGRRDARIDGVFINGEFVPGRSCNSTYGTQSVSKLRVMLPRAEIEPHYDEGKHLYWVAVGRSGWAKAARMGLASVAYPKPAEVLAL